MFSANTSSEARMDNVVRCLETLVMSTTEETAKNFSLENVMQAVNIINLGRTAALAGLTQEEALLVVDRVAVKIDESIAKLIA